MPYGNYFAEYWSWASEVPPHGPEPNSTDYNTRHNSHKSLLQEQEKIQGAWSYHGGSSNPTRVVFCFGDGPPIL